MIKIKIKKWEMNPAPLLLPDDFHTDGPHRRLGKLREGGAAQVHRLAKLHKGPGPAPVGHLDQHAFVAVNDLEPGAQRIIPTRGGQRIGIKRMPVGHAFSALPVAVPGDAVVPAGVPSAQQQNRRQEQGKFPFHNAKINPFLTPSPAIPSNEFICNF